MIGNNSDILLISETKLDDAFRSGQFKICGFNMHYRYDRDSMGRELLLYIRDDIATKLLKHILELILKTCQLKLIYEKEMICEWLLQSA